MWWRHFLFEYELTIFRDLQYMIKGFALSYESGVWRWRALLMVFIMCTLHIDVFWSDSSPGSTGLSHKVSPLVCLV